MNTIYIYNILSYIFITTITVQIFKRQINFKNAKQFVQITDMFHLQKKRLVYIDVYFA